MVNRSGCTPPSPIDGSSAPCNSEREYAVDDIWVLYYLYIKDNVVLNVVSILICLINKRIIYDNIGLKKRLTLKNVDRSSLCATS